MNLAPIYAEAFLNDLHYNFLLQLRNDIYDSIENHRLASIHENEVVRPSIQANIRRIGRAIEIARAHNADQNVIDVLIEQVQMFNRQRHDNREVVKELAFEQAVNKAMLAEVSRAISVFEEQF